MNIICENVINSSLKFTYMKNEEFITAKPESATIPQLGVSWKYEPCFLPQKYENYSQKLHNFEIRPDDVVCLAFPKTGTNLTQEMIWLLNNNLDFEKAQQVELRIRYPLLEFDICYNQYTTNILDKLQNMPGPRHFKSHLPAGLLPEQIWTIKPKIIYITRGIKDTAISYYHHYIKYHMYSGDLVDFMEALLDDKIIFSPQLHHVRDFISMKEEKNILFITYEEMKMDLMSILKRASLFLEKNYSDDQLAILEKHLSFDSMRSNPMTNQESLDEILSTTLQVKLTEHQNKLRFIRKGKVGSHKEEMPLDLIERFDKKTDEFNRKYNTNISP